MSKVTILMSAYNAAETIDAAIGSLLTQTYTDLRILIYDDASQDDTAERLSAYNDPRIELKLLKQNRGLTYNLNEGLAEAVTHSDFIARFDADDIAEPERIARQVDWMEGHPEIDVLGTDVIFFNDKTGAEFLGHQPENHDDIAIALFFDFTMLHPTIMMRASTLRAGQWNYDTKFRYSQDFDLWTRMLRQHRFANLPEALVRVREHPQKISRTKRGPQQEFTTRIRKRQVGWILSDADEGEIERLARAARGDLPSSYADLKQLESFLLRLIEGNAERGAYPADLFARAAADLFHSQCRSLLHLGHGHGSYWSRSDIRRFAAPETVRIRLRFQSLRFVAALKRLRRTKAVSIAL